MADIGWAGSWEPLVVPNDTLEVLRELAGTQVVNERTGKPFVMCQVHLGSGRFEYITRTGR
jgi:hypothetical protein